MKIVVIGGVAAGPRAASRVKRLMPDAKVTLINDSRQLSYGACGLPYYASGDINDVMELFKTSFGAIRDEKYFQNTKGLEVLIPYRAENIDRNKKEVRLRNLENEQTSTISYDKLVITTGARPFRLNIPGSDSERIRTFSRPDDARNIRNLAETGKLGSVCIIGAGFIGCELSESFAALWGIETTIIEAEPHVLPQTLDPEIAAIVEAEMVRNGVKVNCGVAVEKFEEDGDSLKVYYKHETLSVDQAVVAVGISPNSELAKNAGLEIGKTGCIRVNPKLQTSDPDIYAGGDCVENYHLVLNKSVFLPQGSIANRHGRIIADNIANRERKFNGVAGSMVIKVFEINVAATGINEKIARENGFDVGCVWVSMPDRAEYYPEWKYLYLKMVYEKRTQKLLGLQAVGPGDVTRRVDMFSSMLQRQGTLDDLFDFEAAYSPPYAGALDPLYVLGCVAGNVEEDDIITISPGAFLEGNLKGNHIIIDVREDEERLSDPIDIDGIEPIEIPLGNLRGRLTDLKLNGEIIVVCHRGVRGYEAVRILKNAGYGQLSFLGGGTSFQKAMGTSE